MSAGATGLVPFPRDRLAGTALEAAHALLGAVLVRDDGRAARIVEVEAYGGEEDAASHARRGLTARNATMYGDPGTAYVYLVYGMYDCLNVVTSPAGRASAVLVRAAEPLGDDAPFRAARAAHRAAGGRGRIAALPAEALLRGPGLLAAGLGITRALDGTDLLDPAAPLRLALPAPAETPARGGSPPRVVAGPRVGIAYAPEPWRSLPWRLRLAGSPAVSGPPSREP